MQAECEDLQIKKAEILDECDKLNVEKSNLEISLAKLSDRYDKIKLLVETKESSKRRREQNPTTHEMIMDTKSSQRYLRQSETKELLEFIHGGEVGAVYGAWDFISRYSSKDLMESFVLKHKRGRFIARQRVETL